MTMALKVFIVDELNRLSDSERAVLEEIAAAKFEQHISDRARYIQPSPNALFAAWLAQDSSPSPRQAGDGSRQTQVPVDSANPAGTGPAANGPFSLATEEEQLTHERLDREADARLADLKRRRPWDFQRDEKDYPQDDGDIQPFERMTAYPWGER